MTRAEIKISSQLDRLAEMNHSGLSREWEQMFSSPPPKASSRKFLLRAIGYESQSRHAPGLSRADLKELKASLAKPERPDRAQKPSALKQTIKLDPGSKLMREWNGKTHMVSVIEEGFVYKDKVWKSLSAIAKDITGAHWSGPRFFGLNRSPS